MSKMPAQKPGKSRQDFGTPKDFLEAVTRRFGLIRTDLAASAANAVAPVHFDEQQNSLVQDWTALRGVAWCNPPFADIGPWAEKLVTARERRGWTLMLLPAGTGSLWFQNTLVPSTLVLDLAPRLCFDGKNSYPKDLILACAGFQVSGRGFWRWK
jgi:phage N-6-adenine-methyltransferase